jgi:membrane protein DedA with SNARE-associated domain
MTTTAVLADGWTDPGSIGYPIIFLGVLLGSIVPIVPTGAVVGAGAALALTSDRLDLLAVVVVAIAGAVIGDLVTFAVCRFGGPRALHWVSRGQSGERVEEVRDQFRRHGWQIIVVGRLLPAGRIPVLLAAGALAYPWRRLVPATVVGATLWAIAYAALGALSGGIFDSPLLATLVATVLVLVVAGVINLVGSRRRPAPRPDEDADAPVAPADDDAAGPDREACPPAEPTSTGERP